MGKRLITKKSEKGLRGRFGSYMVYGDKDRIIGPIQEEQLLPIEHNPWADNFFRPLLLTIMIMCFNLALVNLVRSINPAWNGLYFLLGMLLTTVEAIYSHRVLGFYRSRGISLMRYRLAELVILVLVLKILSFGGKSAGQIGAELQILWQNPGHFVNFEFYVLLLLAAVAWLATSQTIADFDALGDPYDFRSNNTRPLDTLASRFFWGGALIVVISGVTQWVDRAGWDSLVDWRRPSLEGIIANVLIYFTLGLVLLSQARLTGLIIRWRTQNISVAPNLVKQWAKYGLLFLGLLLLIDLVLPTRYTLGFLTSAGIVVQSLFFILILLWQLLLALLFFPLVWLITLLQGQAPPEELMGPSEMPTWPEPPVTGQSGLPWLEALRSLGFWLLIGTIAWYFLKIYLNDHPEVLQLAKRFKLTAVLVRLWSSLWQRFTALARAGRKLIPPGTALFGRFKDRVALSKYTSWAGLRGLSPRERILYYYLNILQRAEQRGLARRKDQTPYEYEPELSQTVPEAEPAVNLLTQAFVQARYSRESFEETQAKLVKRLWQQVRRELHLSGRSKDQTDKSGLDVRKDNQIGL